MMVGVGWVLLAWKEAQRGAYDGTYWYGTRLSPWPPDGWQTWKGVQPGSPLDRYSQMFYAAYGQLNTLALMNSAQILKETWLEKNRDRISGITSYHRGV
jgi:hypothetical protein